MQTKPSGVEWPTLLVFLASFGLLGLATTVLWSHWPPLGLILAAIAIAQFSSLQHEVLHGHPFRSQRLSEALVFPALTIFVPYMRFKDLHLQHHFDPNLTDPYDDPESNYLDPAVWHGLPAALKLFLRANNTLIGRMILGPAVSVRALVAGDLRLIRRGDRRVLRAWALHLLGLVPVMFWLWAVAAMPVWAYLVAAYLGWSLLKIRTFLEHRAHDAARARTVIIESRGPLSLLFLNNNFHAVHHMHPAVPWYRLPQVYLCNRDHYLRRNDGYLYRSYAEVFRQFLFRAKDPVPHPVWPVDKGGAVGGEAVGLCSDNAPETGGVGRIVEEGHPGLVATP